MSTRHLGLRDSLAVLAHACGVAAFLIATGTTTLAQGRGLVLNPDVGWIDDERRALPSYERPQLEENGFDVYMEAVRLSTVSREAETGEEHDKALSEFLYRDGSLAAAREIVAANSAALAKVHEAAALPYVSPAPLDPSGLLPYLDPLRRLARLAAAEVRIEHMDGDDAAALQTARDGFTLSANVPRHGPIIDTLVGAHCARMVRAESLSLLTDGGLESAEYLAHAAYMHELRARQSSFGDTLAFECEWARVIASQIDEGGAELLVKWLSQPMEGPDPAEGDRLFRLWDSGIALEWLEDRYARLAEEAGKPPWASRYDELARRSDGDLEARGEVLAAIVFPVAPLTSFNTWLRHGGMLLAEETAASVAAFRADSGTLPETLDDLVPDYMPELPADPWTGEPLKYRPEGDGYTLYSVGPDGEDHDGLSERWGPDADWPEGHPKDIVFVPTRPR